MIDPRLCHLPTPFQPAPGLSDAAGGPRVWLKRDDCTGLAFGGNKARKLAAILAEARTAGADTLITQGAVQSNHVRQTAAAAAAWGMSCEAILVERVAPPGATYARSGNVLLDHLLGARVHTVAVNDDLTGVVEEISREVRARGGVPYVVPMGGSSVTGTVGYAGCAREILAQAAHEGIEVAAIVVASGSGGTQAGLIAGLHAAGAAVPVIGISVFHEDPRELGERVGALARAASAALGASTPVPAEVVLVEGGYLGTAYGAPTTDGLAALRLAARTEGVLLDPVYTAKAMAGLLDLARGGRWRAGEDVVFVHTGGAPGLFGYEEALQAAPTNLVGGINR